MEISRSFHIDISVDGIDEYKAKLKELEDVIDKFNTIIRELSEMEMEVSYTFPLIRKE